MIWSVYSRHFKNRLSSQIHQVSTNVNASMTRPPDVSKANAYRVCVAHVRSQSHCAQL